MKIDCKKYTVTIDRNVTYVDLKNQSITITENGNVYIEQKQKTVNVLCNNDTIAENVTLKQAAQIVGVSYTTLYLKFKTTIKNFVCIKINSYNYIITKN